MCLPLWYEAQLKEFGNDLYFLPCLIPDHPLADVKDLLLLSLQTNDSTSHSWFKSMRQGKIKGRTVHISLSSIETTFSKCVQS